MTPWWVPVLVGIASPIIVAVILRVLGKSSIWPFTPDLVREQSYSEILAPNNILNLLISPYNNKTYHLERIIPSDYVPQTLKLKVLKKQKIIIDEPLIENMSERGILSGSNLAISKKKPIHLEICNISSLNESIRLTVLYKGSDELSIKKCN